MRVETHWHWHQWIVGIECWRHITYLYLLPLEIRVVW